MYEINKIEMRVIPHKEQRYETTGDYWFDLNNTLQIRTSDLGDTRMNLLVLIHELIEVSLTEHAEIPETSITIFDEQFEAVRVPGNIDEPGDSKNAPYKKQHCIATAVERMMCALLDVDWADYEAACNEA
jgi:hypothetical protein